MSNLAKYIENLRVEFDRASFDNMKNCSDEETVLYLYAYYHYFNADNSCISDVVQGNVYKWDASDRIAGIYIDQDADQNDIDVLAIKFTDNADFDFPAILKTFKDIEGILFDRAHFSSIRPELKALLNNEEYKVTTNRPIKISIITNFDPKNISAKNSILKALSVLKPDHSNVSYHIVFGYDVEHEILEIEEPREFVDTAIIDIDSSSNYITFGDEKSMIVNISAKSLKRIYELYYYRGLFAQNLRYYVKNAKVDANIVESIQSFPDNFWYYNNGIILICDDYIIQDNSILLSNFSIINGGQTTKLIGETDFDKDFFVQCKIIKNKYSDESDRLEFIANVAEASNTQKPIKDKDLIANRPEQRLLKKQLADAGIYCQVKRGEKVNKKLYPAAWQNTTNEELGQFLLSFVYQKPGTARGGKATICGNKERYSLLFGKKYSSDLLGDFLKIKAYYKLWATYVKKNDDGVDPYKVGLVNNGMFFITSIIGVLCKMYYHNSYVNAISTAVLPEQKMEIVSQHDIDHHIFATDMDYKTKLFELFEYCYIRFYRPGYEFLKTFKEKHNNYSNFTKVNNNYNTYVFRQIAFEFKNGIPETDMAILSNILFDASNDDLDRDTELLNKYVNVVFTDGDHENNVSEEVAEEIKEALVAYRTRTYKANHIKAYDVFRNASCDRIAHAAPQTLEDLKELRCLDEVQYNLYGQDIVDIVLQIINA